MHAAQQAIMADIKLIAALHATWMQSSVNRGAGGIFGKSEFLTPWDFVPDLEPGYHRKQRELRREKRNLERWLQAAAQMETKH